MAKGAVVEEFLAPVADGAEPRSGSAGGWRLLGSKQSRLPQGERQLDIAVQRDALQVTKSYVLYPGSSIVREWVTFKNAGTVPLPIPEPCFLNLTVQPGAAQSPDFSWMTGGENNPGSWNLKTESLEPGKAAEVRFLRALSRRNGCRAAVPRRRHRRQDPAQRPASLARHGLAVRRQRHGYACRSTFSADVQPGDKLVFLVNMHGNIGYDTTAFDPTIAYDDGETHTASKEFSDEQGQNGWRYQYLENGKFVDLVYYPAPKQWRKEKDNATGTPFVGVGDQHPDAGQDAARVWTAPKAGRVRITGSVCNTGNGVGSNAGYGFRLGSSSYAPWYALYGQGHASRASSSAGITSATGPRRSRSTPDGSGHGPVESGRPQADARPGRIPHDAQGFRRPLPVMISTTPATNASTGSTATSGITRATAGSRPSACWATG